MKHWHNRINMLQCVLCNVISKVSLMHKNTSHLRDRNKNRVAIILNINKMQSTRLSSRKSDRFITFN